MTSIRKETCNPIAQNCAGDMGCYQANGEPVFLCSAPLLDDTDGKEGSECSFVQSCEPGLQCMVRELLAERNHDSCCALNCDLDADDPDLQRTASREVCLKMHTDPFPANENVGFCGLPVR